VKLATNLIEQESGKFQQPKQVSGRQRVSAKDAAWAAVDAAKSAQRTANLAITIASVAAAAAISAAAVALVTLYVKP